jgi:hypothetical protein
VRKRIRDDFTLRLPLQPVIANRACGVERRFDVSGFEPLVTLLRVVAPDAGEAVGLQLQTHERPGLALDVSAGLTDAVYFVRDTGQVLHVVSHLVRDDVGVGEVATTTEPSLHLFCSEKVSDLFSRTVDRGQTGIYFFQTRKADRSMY